MSNRSIRVRSVRLGLCVLLLVMLTGCDLLAQRLGLTPPSLSVLVDTQAEFIGKGLKVDRAGPELNWLLADIDSLAQRTAKSYVLPSDDGVARYERSFKLFDDVGFVFSWLSEGREVFLIYQYNGRNGYSVLTVHNTHSITIDEALLAVYFSQLRAFYAPFEVKKWQISGPEHDLRPEALDFIGERLFDPSGYFMPFDGRIVSTDERALATSPDSDELTIYGTYGEKILALPNDFSSALADAGIRLPVQLEDGYSADLKVSITAEGTIDKVIAGVVNHSVDNHTRIVFRRAVPDDLLGAGANPL